VKKVIFKYDLSYNFNDNFFIIELEYIKRRELEHQQIVISLMNTKIKIVRFIGFILVLILIMVLILILKIPVLK